MNADRDAFATARWARSNRPRGLPESLAFTLLVLATYANERGECWPGVERLMHDLELSDRAVRRRLERLWELGLVTMHRRPNRPSLICLAVPDRVVGPVAQDDRSADPGPVAQDDRFGPVAQDDLSGAADDQSHPVVQGVRSGPVVHARAGKERQKNAIELPPQPPQAGEPHHLPHLPDGNRTRDQSGYRRDLHTWIASELPDLAADPRTADAVQQAQYHGGCATREQVVAFLADHWPELTSVAAPARPLEVASSSKAVDP